MAQTYPFTVLIILVFAVVVGHSYDPGKKRDLDQIRYKFTSCGITGRSGPSLSSCQNFYTNINSPITQHDLLFEFEDREYEGAQGFQVPKNGLYNITVAGARGGRGICNSEHGGYGYQMSVQVKLSTEYELLILVGQRGTEPCDVIPEFEEAYGIFCRELITDHDVHMCNETWYNYTREFDHSFYEAFGGGAGGGGSLVQARRKDSKVFDNFPIIIAGGGGGSASVLDYDAVDGTAVKNAFPTPNPIQSYGAFVNGKARRSGGGSSGVRGARKSSSNKVAGAGGGYKVDFRQPISQDGRALSSAHNFAEGGLDCTHAFIATGHDFPYSGVYGGFGGGGGACGGGGGGGGYTGGAILAAGVTIPGEGGYSLTGNSITTSFRIYIIVEGTLNREDDDGFVEIILANCGCVHTCFVNSTEDTFECLCPNNTMLAPDLSDCFAGTEVPVGVGPLEAAGSGLYYRFIELQNSTFLLSNDMYIQSNDEICILFWLGEESQIVLTTDAVRGPGRINRLAVVDNDTTTSPILSTMLNSSVLVTGALLIGTGDCTVVGNTVSINASIQSSLNDAVSALEFLGSNVNNSAVVEMASMLATQLNIFILNKDGILNRGTNVGLVIGVAMVILLLILAIIAIISFLISWRRSKRSPPIINGLKHEPTETSFKILESDDESSYGIPKIKTNGKSDLNSLESSLDIPRFFQQNVKLIKTIGEGKFGVVYQAEVTLPVSTEKQTVALKTLKGEYEVEELKKECRMTYRLDHPNVLRLVGICLDGETPYLIMPLMERGSLLMHLRKERENLLVNKDLGDDNMICSAQRRLSDMCHQIAKGMEYIAGLNIIHRDLAARNCMIDGQGMIKVSDFGLSESIYNSTYLRFKNDKEIKLPVKWTAPESISDGVYSEKTDMWSFGVTCWEVFSVGKTPYPGMHPLTAINMIEDGYRMKKPKNYACTDKMYTMMMECWNADSKQRPSFSDIVKRLSRDLDKFSDAAIVTISNL